MSENARKEETTDDSGFCRVRFLSNPGRWTGLLVLVSRLDIADDRVADLYNHQMVRVP